MVRRGGASQRGCILSAALAALVLVAVLVPGVAQARWSPTFDLAAPGTLDIQSPQLTLSPSGTAAAAFGTLDVDTPGSAQAYLTLRSPQGVASAPMAITGAAQILGEAYDHGTLTLVTGAAAPGQVCCTAANAVTVGSDGTQSTPRPLVGGLAGPALATLVPLADGHTVAAVATERGVWVIQSRGHGVWGPQHLLTGAGKMPQMLASARVGANGSALAWVAPSGIAGATDPRTISVATAGGPGAPRQVRTGITVPGGHRVEELGIAARGRAVTLAWIESWFDKGGAYHAVVRAIDLTRHSTARTLSPAGATASGLQFAGDPAGDQTITWQSCTAVDRCTGRAVSRTRRGTFGTASSLGSDDPDQPPALAVSSTGQAVVALTRGGRPMAATRSGAGGRFSGVVRLSPSPYAYDITDAAGTGGRAIVGWTQGTLNPSVVAAADGL